MIAERPATTPRSAANLAVDIANVERDLMEAHRENGQARTNRPRLMAAGDAQRVAACNAEIARTDKLILELTERVEATREAIKAANARDIQAENEKSFRRISKAVNEAANDAGNLDSIIQDLGDAIAKLAASKEAADSAMQQAGVLPLRDHLTAAQVKNIVDMGLYVSTAGQFGKPVTLDSLHELRQSKRASLNHAASEYRELTLRHARITLRVEVQ